MTSTTTAAPDTGTASALPNTRAALLIQEHAERSGLPIPHIVYVDAFSITFHVRSLADLTAWAEWMETTVEAKPYGTESIHHTCEGLVLDQPLTVFYVQVVAR